LRERQEQLLAEVIRQAAGRFRVTPPTPNSPETARSTL
jgi:hypothetical protein